MSAADEAYEAAKRLIAEAKRTGATELSFARPETRALTALPPELGELRHLNLNNTKISNLAPLSSLTALTNLRLGGTGVTDLAPLSGLTALTVLWLNGTKVSDLAPLSGLTALTRLRLDRTGVRDLTPLSGLTALAELWLDRTGVSDLAPLSGLTGLTRLRLTGTKVSELTPLSGLTGLTGLRLDGTGVSDLAPLSGLTALAALWLDGTGVLDLRPMLALRESLVPPERANSSRIGVTFRDTPATRADAGLAKIAEIEDRRERNLRLLDYLENWKPPADLGGTAPQSDALLPVALVDGRLEIAASVPTEAERDERLKRVVHERLRAKAPELAQAAGNQFPRLAGRARALAREVDKPFEELDMLLIHLEVDDLADCLARKADREGEEEYTPDVVDALSDVARTGPGLTLDHPAVDLLEERKRRYAADPPGPEEKAAQDEMSRAVAEDAAAIGDRLREMEARILESVGGAVAGALQRSSNKNILWKIGAIAASRAETVVLGVGTGILTTVYGPALTEFVAANWAVLVEAASSFGPRFADWFVASVGPVPEVRARLPGVDPGRRGGKGRK